MEHEDRVFEITEKPDLHSMAYSMLAETRPLCQGYRFERNGQAMTVLNDTAPDTQPPVWVVFVGGVQVDLVFVLFAALDVSYAVDLVYGILSRNWCDHENSSVQIPYDLDRLTNHPEGTCEHCS